MQFNIKISFNCPRIIVQPKIYIYHEKLIARVFNYHIFKWFDLEMRKK